MNKLDDIDRLHRSIVGDKKPPVNKAKTTLQTAKHTHNGEIVKLFKQFVKDVRKHLILKGQAKNIYKLEQLNKR